MSDTKLQAVRELIVENHLEAARAVLLTLNEIAAQQWLAQVDRLIATQAAVASKGKAERTQTVKYRLRSNNQGMIDVLLPVSAPNANFEIDVRYRRLPSDEFSPEQTYLVDELNIQRERLEHPRAYLPWSSDEETQMIALYRQGKSIDDIAAVLQRHAGAVRARLTRKGIIKDESGDTR